MTPRSPAPWLFVVGARPQFIKLAAVLRAAERLRPGSALPPIQTLHTGQHYDHGMSQIFFDEMELPVPNLNLGIGSGLHGAMTGRMLEALEREFVGRGPSMVITFGDTNSTLAAALAAAKLHIPTAHIEAGLRSFNRAMAEEINRVVADHVSDLLFCPSEASRHLLEKEGLTRGVHVVGDVMFDTFLHYRARAIEPKIQGPFALATLHRPETVDHPEKLAGVLASFGRCPVPVRLPMHPRTRGRMDAAGLEPPANVQVIEPLSYFEMLGHLDRCAFVITDSGGLQKEAFYAGKRCITARDETEWTELVDIGANRVVGTDPDAIAAAFDWAAKTLDASAQPYGDGKACERILRVLLDFAPSA